MVLRPGCSPIPHRSLGKGPHGIRRGQCDWCSAPVEGRGLAQHHRVHFHGQLPPMPRTGRAHALDEHGWLEGALVMGASTEVGWIRLRLQDVGAHADVAVSKFRRPGFSEWGSETFATGAVPREQQPPASACGDPVAVAATTAGVSEHRGAASFADAEALVGVWAYGLELCGCRPPVHGQSSRRTALGRCSRRSRCRRRHARVGDGAWLAGRSRRSRHCPRSS
mmetsp:Transcript_27994/g.90185  ORF Transcript_27994/g.90185 Transcript_27994/m.90185 type:complete len:223 (+) Transcript_27994:562-1230(+)